MISANGALIGFYDYAEVARSVLIAIAASYAALDLAGRVSAARGRVRLAWLGGGAIAMGIGIWEMHFKGMLAFHLPAPVEYHWPTVLASLLVAILASAVALYVSSRHKMGSVEALTGSVIMGAGIAGMHYIGMAAMRLPAITQYSPLLVTFSILLAILFSLIALLMAFDLREETRWTVPRRLGSATVMGAAVSAMHYTGMAAASFMPASAPDLSHAVNISPLANSGIAIVTLIVIVAAVVTSSVDRRTGVEARQRNQELERRVAERTLELEAVNQELRKEIAERERAEEAVRRSEDRLRLVIDTLPALVWSKLPDGSADFLNQRFLEYTGLSVEEALGWGWMKEFHPEKRAEEEWRAAFAAGEPFEREAQLRRADGEYRWFLLRAVPLRDELGNVVKWYGTNTDIEDRKQAAEHLRLVIDTTPAMLHSARPDGYVDFFNKRWLEYVGVSLEDISGWQWTSVIHPEDVEDVVGKWRSSVASGRPFETEARLRRADGEYRLMLLRKVPLRDEAGNIVKWYGSAIDIEERKRAEQELRQAEEHIRAILEYSPNWIFLKDTEGRYLLVNREIERVFGISQEQIKGKTDSEIFPPEQAAEYRANDLKVLRAGLPMEFEETGLLEDGPHTSIVHKFPLFDTHGNIYATGGVATDITERKRAEEARRYSEEQYRTVVETATDAVVSIDGNSKIFFVNPATTKIFGYDTSELIGRPLTMLMPESLRKLHEAGFRRYLATGQRHLNWQGTELTGLRKNGQEFPVEVSFGEMISNGHKVFTGFIRDITEKKRAEDELRKQKEVFQKIFENIPVTISFIGQDGRIEMVNPEWERTLGWTLEEIRKQNLDLFAEFYPDPQYRQWVLDLTAASTGEWTDRKVKVRGGRVIDLAMAVVHLSDGTSIAIGRDITERKRAEEALRGAAEFDEAALKSLGEGLYTIDINGLVTSMNPAAEELFGWSFAELRGKKMHEMTHHHYPDGRPFPSSECAGFQVLTHGQPLKNYEDVFIRKDGTFFDVVYSIAPIRDAAGQINSLVVVISDITERKRAEAELRESEARFRLVADSAPVMIWTSGTDKLCSYFNKPWLDFTGRSIDRELGNGWAEGVHPEDSQRCLDTYTQAFDRREEFRMEYRLRRHDGEFRWVLDIGVPRFNPDGTFAGYIGSCIDVSEQRRAEEELRQAQAELARVTRAFAMGELVASIAHEVNQPLTGVVTNGNFTLRELGRATPNVGKAREAIAEIVEDGMRASEVISKIRALFTKGAPDRVELNINDLIQEAAVLTRNEASQNRVQVRLDLASGLPLVKGDRVQLRQVLINLVNNGIEAMRVVTDRPRQIVIQSAKHADGVLVRVEDSGKGLGEEQAVLIFEPFFTTKPQGIGTGLSISRSIIESHGGRLWAEPGSHGAIFQFILPIDSDRASENSAA